MIKIPEGVVAESIPNDVLKIAMRKSYQSAYYRLDDHHKAEDVANDIALTHYNYLEEQRIFVGDEPNWEDHKCLETYGVKGKGLTPLYISFMYLTKKRAFGYVGNSGAFEDFDSDSFGSDNLDDYLVRLEFEHIYNFVQESIVDVVEKVYQQALSNAKESMGSFEFIDFSKKASDDSIVANYCRDKMLDEISYLEDESNVKSHFERCLYIGIKETKANAFSYAYTQFRANVSDLIMAQLKERFGDIKIDGISNIIGSRKDNSNKPEPYVKSKSITLTSCDKSSAYIKAFTLKESVKEIDTWFFDQSVKEGHVFYDENNHSLCCSLDDAPYSMILNFIEFMQSISRKTGLNFEIKISASVLVQKKSHAFEKVEIDAGVITPFRISTINLEEVLKPVVRTIKELESFSVSQEA